MTSSFRHVAHTPNQLSSLIVMCLFPPISLSTVHCADGFGNSNLLVWGKQVCSTVGEFSLLKSLHIFQLLANSSQVLLGRSNSLLFVFPFSDIPQLEYERRWFTECNYVFFYWITVKLFDFLFVIGLLVVCFVGLPGEAPAARSPLLHQTAGQEMRSAPQHTGKMQFAPLYSNLCYSTTASTTSLCITTNMRLLHS